MKHFFRKTMREQLQTDFNNLNELAKKPTPKAGWIKVLRQALAMTGGQLAQRIKCTQSNITTLEQREKTGNISIKALEQVAKAMNCRCVYFLIPEKPLEQIMEDQARLVAKKRLQSVAHSMALEQQGLTPQQMIQQEEALVRELLDHPKSLWDDK